MRIMKEQFLKEDTKMNYAAELFCVKVYWKFNLYEITKDVHLVCSVSKGVIILVPFINEKDLAQSQTQVSLSCVCIFGTSYILY